MCSKIFFQLQPTAAIYWSLDLKLKFGNALNSNSNSNTPCLSVALNRFYLDLRRTYLRPTTTNWCDRSLPAPTFGWERVSNSQIHSTQVYRIPITIFTLRRCKDIKMMGDSTSLFRCLTHKK